MKQVKKGFTLAEVLLAMSIIGIIAAILVPQLVLQVEKEKTGPMLGKIVEQIELGCKNMMQDYYNETGTPVEAMSLMSDNDTCKFTVARMGEKVGAEASGSRYAFNKFKASYEIKNLNLNNHSADAKIADIIIDTNSDNKPNKTGKDQFKFELRNDGRLVPYGIGAESSCTGTQDSCAARVVADGFKVKY